ncbi:hypothetical protein HYFRA_00007396 [Hymenoscyphus fraxineus]|uniref:Uncharacterized protein n=1 Tax=Hymenoscyphus fraxineus TaxID=746836 RepID=A0A9N9KST3_9HELO|nr:hypothetical protein HYFRA_00007396 [Hymenoscyphus fraxineus]
MSRFFSTGARLAVKWFGFEKTKLLTEYQNTIDDAMKPGGNIEKAVTPTASTVGKIEKGNIKSRDGEPVHQSHFNRSDKAWIVSARIVGSRLAKTFHIYPDRDVTSSKKDIPKK